MPLLKSQPRTVGIKSAAGFVQEETLKVNIEVQTLVEFGQDMLRYDSFDLMV